MATALFRDIVAARVDRAISGTFLLLTDTDGSFAMLAMPAHVAAAMAEAFNSATAEGDRIADAVAYAREVA
jgi:hypothetical protein